MFSPNRTIRNHDEIYQPMIVIKIKEESKQEESKL